MSDALVLAVDGGGVKTDLALLDTTGTLLSVVRGGSSQAHYLGVEGCAEVIAGLLDEAIAGAGLGPIERPLAASAWLLLAGADLPEEVSALRLRFEQLSWSKQLCVDSDMPALLRAGTDRGWGVAVVCGGGINCLGRAPDGREVRFPSLGPISGDWGGSRDIGLAALAAAARSADGRGPRTVLENVVPAHFGLSGALEVSRALHFEEMSELRLRELASIVLAFGEEDPVAAGIVRRVADEVIAFARAALRRLELTGADPDVVLGGGVLRAVSPSVIELIARGVHEVAPSARLLVSSSEPIVGAALLALDTLGADAGTIAHARAELNTAVEVLGRPAVVDRLR